jgi:hypothetical protein
VRCQTIFQGLSIVGLGVGELGASAVGPVAGLMDGLDTPAADEQPVTATIEAAKSRVSERFNIVSSSSRCRERSPWKRIGAAWALHRMTTMLGRAASDDD